MGQDMDRQGRYAVEAAVVARKHLVKPGERQLDASVEPASPSLLDIGGERIDDPDIAATRSVPAPPRQRSGRG